MSVDLCVVTYNNRPHIERLLETLFNTIHEVHPVTQDDAWWLHIADNGSTDGTREYLDSVSRRFHFDSLVYNNNVGYAEACNQLAAMGNCDNIALLNGDVWFTSQNVVDLDRFLRTHSDVAVVGPKSRNEACQINHAGIDGTNERPYHRSWMKEDVGDVFHRDVVPMVSVSGSAFFVNRSIWNELKDCPIYQSLHPGAGAFLPTRHYYEETWFAYHARAHGYNVMYNGEVSIGHTWHASSPVGGEADKEFQVSRAMFREACDAHGILRD